ncbi:MAG TPA: RIO1 family regulatory kinase/ATPase [Candidatus Bathyarchaeia archaeon]
MVNLQELGEEPYASIICYPRSGKDEVKKRINELQKLSVEAVEFHGHKLAFNLPVLGKGYVGIVTIAYVKGKKVALKIRRVDADRSSMQHEAEMLKAANSVDVGPMFLDASKNFLLMQFIEGDLLPAWLEKDPMKEKLQKVLREILEQCWRLDKAGLDHGELSHAPKHIIIAKKSKPFIVDFETASIDRRPSNVTSICQFLFFSRFLTQLMFEKVGEKNQRAIIETLREYKTCRNRENFNEIIKVCSL